MAFEPAEQLGSAMKGWVIDGCRFATSVWEWEDPLFGYSFIFWSLVGVYRWPSCSGGGALMPPSYRTMTGVSANSSWR